jgi:hypothetical protein
MKSVKQSRKHTYYKFAWETGENYIKHITEYSEKTGVEFKVSLKWFLSMMVHNPYVEKYYPGFTTIENKYKLFNQMNLVGDDLNKIHDEYQKFRSTILENIECEVVDVMYFKKQVQSEVHGSKKIKFKNRLQLVDMLLVVGLLQDRDVDLDDLENVMKNEDLLTNLGNHEMRT